MKLKTKHNEVNDILLVQVESNKTVGVILTLGGLDAEIDLITKRIESNQSLLTNLEAKRIEVYDLVKTVELKK